MLLTRLVGWVRDQDRPMNERLIGGARLTTTLAQAALKKVRGPRFGELLDLLVQALPSEFAAPPEPPNTRQHGMLRQLAFAHAEHLTFAQMRAGTMNQWRRRWFQLRCARRFRKGTGPVPRLPGASEDPTFAQVASVAPAGEQLGQIESLLLRYVLGRLTGRSVFGEGYYGWPIFSGLAALWLSVAAAGWLARYQAAVQGRQALSFDDLAAAIGVVDRAASRLPVLGTLAERARINYLLGNDGLARLTYAYSPIAAR